MSRIHRKKLWKNIGRISIALLLVLSGLLVFYKHSESRLYRTRYEEAKVLLQYYQEQEVPPLSDNVREVFISEAELAGYLESGDRIDVRIRYSNAEDYLVLADKKMIKYGTGNGMVLGLSEEEILRLSSAISDCQRYDNTKLYAVAYPESIAVETGCVTYLTNRDIQRMLGTQTTEGESRIALEERLKRAE